MFFHIFCEKKTGSTSRDFCGSFSILEFVICYIYKFSVRLLHVIYLCKFLFHFLMIFYVFSQQAQLNVHQLTAALMVVVRMQSAYVKELHLCAAVCLEQQAGLRLNAIQVGQGTHYSFNNIDYTGLVTTLCFICSAEMVVLYLFHKVLQLYLVSRIKSLVS